MKIMKLNNLSTVGQSMFKRLAVIFLVFATSTTALATSIVEMSVSNTSDGFAGTPLARKKFTFIKDKQKNVLGGYLQNHQKYLF